MRRSPLWQWFIAAYIVSAAAFCEDEASFTASPRLNLWQFQPVKVLARFVVLKPYELWCAGVAIEYGDGSFSSVEATCESEDLYTPPERWVWSRHHDYKTAGQFTLTLTFFRTLPDGKVKILKRHTAEITIQ